MKISCIKCNEHLFDTDNDKDYIELLTILERAKEVRQSKLKTGYDDIGQYLHEKIKIGTDKNILVFDADACSGQFTKRLVTLMKHCVKRNPDIYNASRLTTLFVDVDAVADVSMDCIDFDGNMCSCYGVELFQTSYLNEDSDLIKYFNDELKGSLSTSDKYLVIGITSDGTPILGSY